MSGIWDRSLRPFIEHHFSLFLLGAFFIALIVPDLSFIPKQCVPVLLALIILFSCSKIKIEEFKQFRARDVAGFIVIRFGVLPIVLFFCASYVLPKYEYVLLLLAMLPCGATLSAMMAVVGGSPALGLTATAITCFLAPLSIPFAFSVLGREGIEVDVIGMAITLVFMIVVPVILYFGFLRRFEKVKLSMRKNSSAAACLLICMNVIIVVSYQQDKFFENFGFLFFTLMIGAVMYLAFYIFGWFYFLKGNKKQKVSYSLMSGNNNINLGISLAVLFMPDFEALVLILWELSWILGLVFFQLFVRHHVDDIV